MHLPVVQRILGLLLMIFSISMLPPIIVSLIYRDGSMLAFIYGFAVTILAGLFIWLPVREERARVTLGEGGTPLLTASRLGKRLAMPRLLIKDESLRLTICTIRIV